MNLWPSGWAGADLVFFDCDSTLAAIEGVDELARRRGVDVAELTRQAMDGEIPLDEVYGERLRRIGASLEDLEWLAGRYRETVVPGAAETVAALHGLGVECALLSGGLRPALLPLAADLGVPEQRVHAVPYAGAGADAIAQSCAHPLARAGGKPQVIREHAAQNGVARARILLVGDGASDLEAAPEVGLFAGFGGVCNREAVRRGASIFLEDKGLHAVALLAAGPDRASDLERAAPLLYDYGFRVLRSPRADAFRNG